MAQNIFERYGVKEVADVRFIALGANPDMGWDVGDVVIYLDTLKISTIETTADQTEARGGRGNPPFIIWDFGQEITVTLQDALFSMTSLAVMLGARAEEASASAPQMVEYTEEAYYVTAGITPGYTPVGDIKVLNLTKGTRGTGTLDTTDPTAPVVTITDAVAGDRVRLFYDVEVDGTDGTGYTIIINATTFPGTYKVVGDALKRNEDGVDSPMQFVINRAKMASEVTFNMEAEGDPSVFDMNLRVLRDADGDMIRFISYELPA